VREIGRIAQGYFPTQPRIAQAIANLFIAPPHSKVTLLDPGCGCATAINDIRHSLQCRTPSATVKCYGIESDRGRAEQAHQDVSSFKGGGEVLWSAIEDCDVEVPASLLFFNPPYDRIRKGGRLETLLFNKVKTWAARNAHLVLIVPDYILADQSNGLAVSVERDFRMLHVFRYPEPEYKIFKQCVFVGQRREKALAINRVDFPSWAWDAKSWPILPDKFLQPKPLLSVADEVSFYRTSIGKELILETLSRSPLRNSLLREALAPEPPIERPLLPLRDGHLALALAGGLCDGAIEDKETGDKFLVKGTLERKTVKVGSREKFGFKGEKTHDIHIHRTRYCMNVRCLREDGTIENYSSQPPEEEKVETTPIESEDAHV